MRTGNTRRRPTFGLEFAVCMLGLIACVPDVGDPFVTKYESARLRIGTTFESGLCLGDREMWEAHLSVIEQTLDVSRDFVWLLVYDDEEEHQIAADCGWNVSISLSGCWDGSVARSILDNVPHELVHAWAATVQHTPIPALREGIAVAMSGLVPHLGTKDLTVDDLFLTEFPPEKYTKAGHLVAWLLATYGPKSFMALYTQTTTGMTRAEMTTTFLNVLGTSPEDLLLAHENSAKEYYPATGAAACGRGPVVPWKDDAATWPAEGSCEDGPFFGFETSDWWQRVTIEVSTPGIYLLDPKGRWASLTRCLTTPSDEIELPTLQADGMTGDWLHGTPLGDLDNAYDDWADHPIDLDPGTYEVWVERRSRESPGGSEMSLLKL